MLDAFGFWPIGDVVSGIEYRGKNTPDGLEPLIDYFDNTYISGQFRCIQLPTQLDGTVSPIRMHRSHPTFLPELWNIHDNTLTNGFRTNNVCEGWNNVFAKFIGHADPTIRRAIDQCYSKCGTRTGAGTQAMVCRYAKRSQKRNKQ